MKNRIYFGERAAGADVGNPYISQQSSSLLKFSLSQHEVQGLIYEMRHSF